MTGEQYHRDRIGTVVAFAQSHPWLTLLAVLWFYGCLLVVASAMRTPRRGGSRSRRG